MDKKFWIAGIAAALVSFFFSFLAHGILLRDDYGRLPNLFRTETDAQGYFPYMILSHLIKGLAFAWVYAQGIALGTPWLNQGLRFGIAMILLIVVPLYLVYYSVQPMPGMTVMKQIVFDSIGTILMALVVAFIFKRDEAVG
jgi:hypothetical protein